MASVLEDRNLRFFVLNMLQSPTGMIIPFALRDLVFHPGTF